MFASVSPDSPIRGAWKLRYELLPVSIAAHSVALALAVAAGSIRADFPLHPPRLMQAFSVVDLDPPLPVPPPPAAPRGDPRLPVTPSPVAAQMIAAPPVIPDAIPEIKPVQFAAVDLAVPPAEQNDGGDPEGVPGGVPGGVAEGEPGGKPSGIPGGELRDDGKVHVAREVSLSMFRLNQEYPVYPERLRLRGLEADVVLRYTIDKHGLVREVNVLEHAANKQFDEAAVDAARRWRFRPLLIDGEPREVVHEIVVSFRLE